MTIGKGVKVLRIIKKLLNSRGAKVLRKGVKVLRFSDISN